MDAVRLYNEGILFAREVIDEGTVNLLTRILKMEEGHVDWAEMQRAPEKMHSIHLMIIMV
jgi:bacterioferritin (cytochrome b1)